VVGLYLEVMPVVYVLEKIVVLLFVKTLLVVVVYLEAMLLLYILEKFFLMVYLEKFLFVVCLMGVALNLLEVFCALRLSLSCNPLTRSSFCFLRAPVVTFWNQAPWISTLGVQGLPEPWLLEDVLGFSLLKLLAALQKTCCEMTQERRSCA
jgi:hypothetical protein